jgi:hypothetical protein
LIAACATLALAAAAAPAPASNRIEFGIQDDAWLRDGTASMPSLEGRLRVLDRLGPDVVRYTLRWDEIATERPEHPADPNDPAYDWSWSDAVLGGLHAHGIDILLTVWATPRWANGGHPPSWPPQSPSAFPLFLKAAATRYPFVHKWEIWNEPNQRGGLYPNSPRLYVHRLLNPATAVLHSLSSKNVVAGGATSPRATKTALDAIRFMRGMRAAGARFDVYSHHPHPRMSSWGHVAGPLVQLPCSRWLTLGNLQCLLGEVRRDFGGKHVWLTEYAYKTNPPDVSRGVSPALQARYIGESSLRAWRASRVDLMIHFLIRDEPIVGRWASGLYTAHDTLKPSFYAFMLPLAEERRVGQWTTLWGQVRPRTGMQAYAIQRQVRGAWVAITPVLYTSPRGFFTITVAAPRGARVRLWSPLDWTAGAPIPIT